MINEEYISGWKRLKSAWELKIDREVSPELLEKILSDDWRSGEVVRVAQNSVTARRMLRKAIDEFPEIFRIQLALDSPPISISNRWLIWVAVQEDSETENFFEQSRNSFPGAFAALFVRSAIRHLIEVKGRNFVKARALRWWRMVSESEEQQEALVEGIIDGGILDEGIFRELGTEALEVARQAVWREGSYLRGASDISPFSGPARTPAIPRDSSRLDVLFAEVSLATDLRDACLTPAEHLRVSESAHLATPAWSAFARALKQQRKTGNPEYAEYVRQYTNLSRSFPAPLIGTPNGTNWRFPVIRFLHLQQLLAAPRLSKAVNDPTLLPVPEVALFLMGRDDLLFHPELRILRGTDNRWRARWAELAGEAMATMFLEDSVQLDLSLLARIPEKMGALTPDFKASTITGEKLVFEAKGASAWKTHMAQRKHALRQLGKEEQRPNSWSKDGRCFACSLFAAQQGSEGSSLLHVDDPPFGFEDQFQEGWQSLCRREHAIGMLEAARLFDRADHVAQRRERESEYARESVFRLSGEASLSEETSSSDEVFIGTYLPVGEWARSLRHPDPKKCDRIRIFVGIQKSLARDFEYGRFPRGAVVERSDYSDVQSGALTGSSRVGLLPGREVRTARGIYSVLADGAFMAIELE